jgi:DNA polymerase-3 subunit delta'
MLTLLPWHQAQWQLLEQARQLNRMGHALLLSGPYGTGTSQFAEFLAASLFCSTPLENLFPCGQCRACTLYESGNHPDICRIKPAEGKKQIKVEQNEADDPIQIREMIEFIHLKSRQEGYKIAIISPADAMNRSAANALLKTLEEPPAATLIILISDRPSLLPVTIRSRCQQIFFRPVFDRSASAWLQEKTKTGVPPEELLQLASGAPLDVQAIIENDEINKYKSIISDLESLLKGGVDPVKLAGVWNDYGVHQVLKWLMRILRDMLRARSNVPPAGYYRPDTLKCLQQLTNRLDLYKLMMCHDLAMRNYGLATGLVNYNAYGLLEDFIIYWQKQPHQSGGKII